MALTYEGGDGLLQGFADSMDRHAEEITGFKAALTNAQGTYQSSVQANKSAAAITMAFDDAMQKAEALRGRLLQAEGAMRMTKATMNDADDDANAAVYAATYAF